VSIPGVGSTTYHVAGAPPGRYFVRVRGVNGAGAGAPSDEYQLTVGASGLAPPDAPINVATTMFGSRLTMWWDQPTSGGTPTDFLVEAGSGPGLADVATRTVSVRSFSYTPVPTGNFYLRVRARNAAGVSGPSREVLLTVNVAPPPAPPVNFGGTVSASTVTFGWAPGVGGPTSYVLEAGSAPGLSNIATFKTGSAATTVSFSNVPRGTYFVRLRAVNAAGTSAASNEVRLVVP
jgi:predicted phage tail protein